MDTERVTAETEDLAAHGVDCRLWQALQLADMLAELVYSFLDVPEDSHPVLCQLTLQWQCRPPYLMSEPSGLSKTFWRLSSSTRSSFSFKSPGVGCEVEMGAVTPHCLGCVSAILAAVCCCCKGATFSRRTRAEVLRRAGRKEEAAGRGCVSGRAVANSVILRC
jgi:hypothetical protein